MMSTDLVHTPPSFEVSPDARPVKRRAVFSGSVFQIGAHHARTDEEGPMGLRQARRKLDDDSLRLIDDLTNRSMDPLFLDARLMQRHRSTAVMWGTRVVVFVICVAVGFTGNLFIQQLSTDPRREIRESLATELQQQNKALEQLSGNVSDLRGQVEQQSKQLGQMGGDTTLTRDDMANGLLPVTGKGITLTLADPIAAKSDASSGGLPRDSAGTHIRVITDSDLQQLVSLLWQAKAEAIAINGNRIGVQTSIRIAGQTILVGVTQVESPYSIQAIGDSNALAQIVGADKQKSLYESFKASGIYPQVQKNASITLKAAGSGDITHARRSE